MGPTAPYDGTRGKVVLDLPSSLVMNEAFKLRGKLTKVISQVYKEIHYDKTIHLDVTQGCLVMTALEN